MCGRDGSRDSYCGDHIDDTPVHKAVREALANCLINADYYGVRGVIGASDPRNKPLMKMFNLINIGERAGSGVPNIFNVWEDEEWEEPEIIEKFDPDRTVLVLSFIKKVAKKTQEKYNTILNAMQCDKWYKASEFENVVEVKESRIKILLNELIEQELIESIGSTKGKKYRKKT